MNKQSITCDERTVGVENVSYRYAYLVMSFGLLISVAYRSFVLQQSNWDLLALVILGGITATLYQKYQNILSRRWKLATIATVVIAGFIAFLFVLIL